MREITEGDFLGFSGEWCFDFLEFFVMLIYFITKIV